MDGLRASGPTRIHSFNVVRLIACFSVMVEHGLFCRVIHGFFPMILGGIAVNVFFLLSGFLITRILLDAKNRKVPWRYFVVRRSLRIFPVYYLVLIVLTILLPRMGSLRPPGWGDHMHWSFWVYLENITIIRRGWGMPGVYVLGPAWTLCVEEQYYLLWPIAIYLLSETNCKRILAFFCPVVCVASVYYFRNRGLSAGVFTSTTTRGMLLVVGSYMAYHEQWFRSKRVLPLAVALAGVGFVVVSDGYNRDWHTVGKFIWAATLAISAMLIVLAVVEPLVAGPLRWMSWPAVETAGIMTYGMYLFHFPVQGWFNVNSGSISASWKALLATVALSCLSFFLLERRCIEFGKGFRSAPAKQTEIAFGEVTAPVP